MYTLDPLSSFFFGGEGEWRKGLLAVGKHATGYAPGLYANTSLHLCMTNDDIATMLMIR